MLLKTHHTPRIVRIEDCNIPQFALGYSIPFRPFISRRLSGRVQKRASRRHGSVSGSIEVVHSTDLAFGLGPCSGVYLSSRDNASE